MESIKYYFIIYFMIASQYIKTKMQYRADFFISLFGMLIVNVSGAFSFWVIFNSISSLAGWNFYELVFMYSFSLLSLVPLQIFFDNIWQLRIHIVNGTFIKYYLKPLNIMFYYMSEVFDIKGLGQLVFGICLLVYSSIKLCIVWDWSKILLLLTLLPGSSLIMISLMIIAASSGFWIINPNSLMLFVSRFREFARYPITIYNGFFKFLFTYVIPMGFIAYYPSQIFLSTREFDILAYFSPVIGIIFFILAYIIWNRGVSSYSGTGS